METQTDNPQAQAAGESNVSAPGLTNGQAETPLTLAQQAEASNAALKAMYDKQQPGYVEQKQEEATDEVPAAPDPKDEKPAEVQTPPPDDDPADDPKAPEQMRPRLHDPEDIAVAALAKSRGIKLSEAAALIAGTAPKPIPGLDATPQPSSATAELQSQIDALAAEIEEAEKSEEDGGKGDYLTPEHNKKVRQLGKLETALEVAKLRESLDGQKKGEQQATVHQQAVQSSIAAAQKEYPSLTVKDSPLGTASNAVIAEWQADPAKAPRLAQADAPALVAAEAAYRTGNDLFKAGKFPTLDLALASLKTAPVAPVAPAKVTPPPVSAPVAPVRRVNPPSGSKSQTTGGQTPTLQEAINASSDPAEKARLSSQLLASRYAETNNSPNGGLRRGS